MLAQVLAQKLAQVLALKLAQELAQEFAQELAQEFAQGLAQEHGDAVVASFSFYIGLWDISPLEHNQNWQSTCNGGNLHRYNFVEMADSHLIFDMIQHMNLNNELPRHL